MATAFKSDGRSSTGLHHTGRGGAPVKRRSGGRAFAANASQQMGGSGPSRVIAVEEAK